MKEKEEFLYEAFQAKDTRFDGRYFVGISSTKIYCRPTCRAKQPKRENCTFFSSAAEAEQAGYRPCLLCRPELAPGSAVIDASSSLAKKAARLMAEHCGDGLRVAEVAQKLGCTDRHLRRVFFAEYHVSPIQYLQTCRLLLAKNLLTDTQLSVLDVAMASGFGSLRRLNDLFQKRYHLSPTALRKNAANGKMQSHGITVALGYHPPYQWEKMLDFLQKRAIPGVEVVSENAYLRTVRLKNRDGKKYCGWIRVQNCPKKNVLAVTLSDALIPVLSKVLARVRAMFDLYAEPNVICERLQTMNQIRPGACVLGLRVPGCFEPFEMAVRAVLGQQITVKAASSLAGKIALTYGTPIWTGVDGLTHLFPEAEDMIALKDEIQERLGVLGVIAARSRCILALAQALESGEIALGIYADPEQEMAKLMQIKGIGSWTAKYLAMRTMGWPDAFLETDIGAKHALPEYTPKERLELSRQWRPWRSYAMICLWNLDAPGTAK
ncbi:AlkA N-terminal domain-containing protein [Christensenellaceae bacterium 44-20]